MALRYTIIFAYDLYHFWAAGYVARTGGNPYDPTEVLNVMRSIGWPAEEGFHGFLHPPWTLWLFSLISYLPFTIVKLAWPCAITVPVLILLRELHRKFLGNSQGRSRIFLWVLFLCWPPFFMTIVCGQTNGFLLIGLLVWALYGTRAPILSGICLSLSLFKPHLVSFLLLFIGASAIKTGNYRTIAGLALGLVLQTGASLFYAPDATNLWLQGLASRSDSSIALPSASFIRFICDAVDSRLPLYVGVLTGSSLAILWGLSSRSEFSRYEQLVLLLLLNIIFAPYVWMHSYLVLWFCYVPVMLALRKYDERIALIVAACLGSLGAGDLIRPYDVAPFLSLIPVVLLVVWWLHRGKLRGFTKDVLVELNH